MEKTLTKTEQKIYNNHFAYTLLKTLGEKEKNNIDKTQSINFYTLYGQGELDLLKSYVDYTDYIRTAVGENIDINDGFVSIVSGQSVNEIVNNIKQEHEQLKANALLDLSDKVTNHANGLTPNFSQMFIMADFKTEKELDDLIGLACANSYCKDLYIYCKNLVWGAKSEHFLVTINPFYDNEMDFDRYITTIDKTTLNQCEQKAQEAVNKYRLASEDGTALEK